MNAPPAASVAPRDAPIYYRAFVVSSAPESLAAALVDTAGATGVEVRDDESWVEGANRDERGVVVYFAAETPEARADIRRRLVSLLEEDHLAGELEELEELEDRDWRETWKEAFASLRLTDRIAVGPPWDEPETPDEGVALTIEPGMAFGTGMHATTRLAAQLLDERLSESPSIDSVLDVGCGSGILAVAASRLGAATVRGVDVSRDAVEAARENARANRAADVEFSTRPVADIEESYDLVVANIVSSILGELSESLFDAVADDGEVVVSGIRREESFLDDFVPAGWRVGDRRTGDEWTAARIVPS